MPLNITNVRYLLIDDKFTTMFFLREKIEQYVREALNERNTFGYAGNGDEFYTREEDVRSIYAKLGNELNGKIVYCPCDNPSESYIYKVLKEKFNEFGLRGIYATWMGKKACYFDGKQEHITPIRSGRFQDNAKYFNMCDVVVTNPPFTNGQPTQMLQMIMKHGKEYIMIAPKALTQNQGAFNYVRNGKMYALNYNINDYNRPDGSTATAPTAVYTSFGTNRPNFKTGIKYNPNNYRKFDNYDAIDCGDNYNMIPDDYYGNIAVSSNGGGFLQKFNPNQFEIVDKLVRPRMDGKPKKRMIIRRKPQQNSIYSEALRRMKEELGIK